MLLSLFLYAMESFGGIEEEVLSSNLMFESKEVFNLPQFMPGFLDEFFPIHHMNLVAWEVVKPHWHVIDVKASAKCIIISVNVAICN